jgi:hypothetical protein
MRRRMSLAFRLSERQDLSAAALYPPFGPGLKQGGSHLHFGQFAFYEFREAVGGRWLVSEASFRKRHSYGRGSPPARPQILRVLPCRRPPVALGWWTVGRSTDAHLGDHDPHAYAVGCTGDRIKQGVNSPRGSSVMSVKAQPRTKSNQSGIA